MSELNKTPSIEEIANAFNNISSNNNTVAGIKAAERLERQVKEKQEEQQHKKEKNMLPPKEKVPTGTDIREALEEGEYR